MAGWGAGVGVGCVCVSGSSAILLRFIQKGPPYKAVL